MRAWLEQRSRTELAIYGGLVVLALVLRLIDLGHRPFHHDESQDAYFSWLLHTKGDYSYNPLLHGPLRFYLTALAYALFGDSDFTARLAPALMGTVIVALPYGLRDVIGRGAAIAMAVLLAVGPSFLYFSRFAREDIYVACITLGLLVVAMRFLHEPGPRQPMWMGGLLAASFATKETTFITVFVAGTYLVVLYVVQGLRGGWGETPLIAALRSLGAAAWLKGLAAFAIVFTVLFTVFFTDPGGLWKGLHDGLAYWLDQQPVARGGEPVGFYAFLLVGMEWPMLVFGAIGTVVIARHPSPARWLAVWTFVVTLIVYSWASEKFAWLILHPLLPLLVMASIGLQATWEARRGRLGQVGLAVAALGAVFLLYGGVRVNVVSPADPREILVSTQSSSQVLDVRDEVERLAKRKAAQPFSVTIDSAEGATFPWAWYFRESGAGYIDMGQANYEPTAPVLIVTDSSRATLAPKLTDYVGRPFFLRVWWVKRYRTAYNPAEMVKWMITREPWNPTGGLREWLYVRSDLVTRQTTVPSASKTRRPSASNAGSPAEP